MKEGRTPRGARPSLATPNSSGGGSADRHAADAIALLAHFLHIILVGIDHLGRPFVPGVPAILAIGRVAQVAAEFLFGLENVRSEEHTSELQSLMRSSYAVF